MDSKYDSLTLKNQLCFPIYLVAKEITKRYSYLLEELDLTYTQYIVMMYFWEKRTSNVKEIGNILLLDSSTLTPLLKKLEVKGYITRSRSLADERNLIVSVTDKGLKLRDKALNIPVEMTKCVDLEEEEAKTLYEITNKILKNITKEEK
jgi:DNA-binding MarR family transcriptional regulator